MTDLIPWLLEAETPTIRYLTYRDLLHRPIEDPQLKSVQQAIMTDGPVPAMLSKQTTTGQWSDEHSYYTPKYVSTHWSMMLLTELCVDPADERFQRGADYMLSATDGEVQALLAENDLNLACFWGNLLRYVLHAGRGADPRVALVVDYLIADISADHCRCEHNYGFSCAWGVVRALWGLAALPNRSEVQATIDHALEFLLDSYSLVDVSYPTPDKAKVHTIWSRLNFPLFYQTDILFTLRVLAELDVLDHTGVAPALDWLEAQQLKKGYWRGSSPYRQRTWPEMGDPSETARWVSVQAATILQQAGRMN
jgi:hypothetical protein